ncbi:MAG: hypothetical protein ACQRW7_07840 [Caulobacterales bacterium]|uniref:hypothetical protein n=1 Tax=Glycocaulis sp. TaxID=1969725 RepID=UPI003F9EFC3D
MRGKDFVGLFNMVVVAGVLGAISYAALVLQPEEYDPETLCLVGAVPSHRVLVIDKTDLYSPEQAGRIEALALQARDRLDVGERFSLFELDERGELTHTNSFSLCNPGRGEQINPLYRNPNRVEARYQALFERPLQRALADLVRPKDAPQSPILEALARLAQEETFNSSVPRRQIVLVSDMLQNSSLYSVYGQARQDLSGRLPDPETIARQIENEYGDVLRGTEIEVSLVAREGWSAQQRAELQAHWQAVFARLGMRQSWQEF